MLLLLNCLFTRVRGNDWLEEDYAFVCTQSLSPKRVRWENFFPRVKGEYDSYVERNGTVPG